MKKRPLKFGVVWFLMIQVFLLCSIYGQQIEFEDYPHPIMDSLKHKVRFGYLTVPETRSDTNKRTLQIGFCVLKSTAKSPLKDAVIYLPGGPGLGNTDVAPFFLAGESINRILKERDIILFDPRGCGTSDPQLCGSLEDPELFNANLTGLSQDEYLRLIGGAMEKCRDSLALQGMNPDSYGSGDIAMDVEDLRLALGYSAWNLRGHSYGSRYAQSVIRQYPDKVRSAVLSGLVPAALSYEDSAFFGMVHTMRLIIDQCAADSACNKYYPDLEKELLQLLARVEKNPIILPPGTTDLLPRSSLVLSPNTLLGGLFQAMYSREGIEMIPLLIHAVSMGNDWIAEPLALSLGTEYGLQNDMFHTIRCNDNPGVRFTKVPLFQDPLVDPLYPYWIGDQTITEEALCKNLSIPLDSLEQVPVHSNIPMLLFTGEFDPVTPTYNTDAVSKYFPGAISFVVPGRGHDAAVPIPDLIADFFINPKGKPDLAVLKRIEPVHFLANVRLNKGISTLALGIAKGNYLGISIIVGIILLMILSGFIYFPLYRLLSGAMKIRRGGVIRPYLAAWIVSLAGVVVMLLFYLAVSDALTTHPNMLAFGLPGQWSFIFYAVWFVMLALVVSALGCKSVWNKETARINKLFWSLSWFGGFALVLTLWLSDMI